MKYYVLHNWMDSDPQLSRPFTDPDERDQYADKWYERRVDEDEMPGAFVLIDVDDHGNLAVSNFVSDPEDEENPYDEEVYGDAMWDYDEDEPLSYTDI